MTNSLNNQIFTESPPWSGQIQILGKKKNESSKSWEILRKVEKERASERGIERQRDREREHREYLLKC